MTALESRAFDAPPSTELFRGLAQSEIDSILAAAKTIHFRASSVMTRQGEPADKFFLLWKGRARYFFYTPNGKKLILRWITPGHIFGAAAIAVSRSCLGILHKLCVGTSSGRTGKFLSATVRIVAEI